MVAVLLAYMFGHLLVDELTESLTRPVTVFKQLPAVKAQSKTGTVLAMVRAGIRTVFVMAGAGFFVFDVVLAGMCSVFTMARAVIWFVFAVAHAGTLTVLAVGQAVVFSVFVGVQAGAATLISQLLVGLLYQLLALLVSLLVAALLIQVFVENSDYVTLTNSQCQ